MACRSSGEATVNQEPAPHRPPREDPSTPGPVPPELHSVYAGGPFTRCIVCDGDLADREYQVQKTFRASEAVFEMAICRSCAECMNERISKESTTVLRAFMLRILHADVPPAHCRSCGRDRAAAPNIVLLGICRGDRLLLPVLQVCETCQDAVQMSLSRKTRDVYGEFVRDNFPGVPEGVDVSPVAMG